MSSELTVSAPATQTISIQKEKTIASLRKKFHGEKLEMIKTLLHNNGITIDPNAKTVDELIKYIKSHENSNIAYKAEQMIAGISQNLQNLLSELENGSMNAFQKFIKKAEDVVAPLARVTTKSLAVRTAVTLAPTVASKLVVSAGITGWNTFKLIRNKKERAVLTRENELEKILQELEVTIIDDTIIDTRFNEEAQEKIRDFLKKKKIDFVDSGYISLRQAIHSLDFMNKKELCHILNDLLHRELQIEERLNKRKGNFFEKLKQGSQKITKGVLAGVGAATAVNSIDPALLAGPLNGTVLGYIAEKLMSNNLMTKIMGVTGTVGTAALEWIPVVGEQFENIFAAENMIALGIVGGGLGIAGIAASSVMEIAKNIKNKFKYISRSKEIRKLDAKCYADSDAAEWEIMRRLRSQKENTPEEQMMIDLVYGYIANDLKQPVNKPENIYELTTLIGSLDDNCKQKLTQFFEKLKDCNSKNYGDFVNFIIKSGKTISTLTLLGFAGLSVYDLLKDGTFLPEVSAKLFADVPDNVYLMEKMAELQEISDQVPKEASTEFRNIPADQFGKTQQTYTGLSQMTEEVDAIDAVANDFSTTGTELKNDLVYFSEHPIEVIKDGLKPIGDWYEESAKPYWQDVFNSESLMEAGGKLWDGTVSLGEDMWNSIVNGGKEVYNAFEEGAQVVTDIVTGEKRITYDGEKIISTIASLSDNEKINLIHYFNSLSESNITENGRITYEAISQALQGDFLRLEELIADHNAKVAIHQGISNVLNVVTPSAEVISTLDDEVQKPIVRR